MQAAAAVERVPLNRYVQQGARPVPGICRLVWQHSAPTAPHRCSAPTPLQGPCDVMRQNPWNAVLCLGHGNGTVTMWTPNITTPVVRMLCHHGPVRSLAVDGQGRHMVTTGADGQASVAL